MDIADASPREWVHLRRLEVPLRSNFLRIDICGAGVLATGREGTNLFERWDAFVL